MWNQKSIDEYKLLLKKSLNNAIQLPFKSVLINGSAPKPNNCHYNAQTYEEESRIVTCVRGWLVIDGGSSSSQVIMLPHSVIKDIDDRLYEITPIESLEPRPFLESMLSENDFCDLHNHLTMISSNVILIIEK